MSHFNVVRVTGNLCRFSPNGDKVAYCVENKLTVRHTRTFDECHTFSCVDVIEHIEWSPDNQYILCALYQYSTIQVFSLRNHDWKCKLKDTVSGIVDVWWSPDSRHILTCAEFHVSICIWSLVSQSVKHIRGVKETTSPSLAFSADGRWLAVVGQQGAVDCVSIFSTSWDLKKQIACVGLGRVEGFSWTLDSSAVCVWEGSQGICHLQVYGAARGDLIGNFELSCVGVMSGIKTMAWAGSGQFLGLSCFDDKLVCGRPVIISSLQLDLDKPTELSGIGLAVFSSCGYFLATRADKMPAAIWIWSIKETRLHAVIVHKQPVTAICWAPDEPRLAIVSGSNFVSIWISKEVTVCMTDHICVSDVRWQPSGECLALYAGTKVVFLPLSVF
ncbi:hypothetical protein Cfor_03839 [Coptotermes formosanus]|uniref:WD repeat-containing protein WRAP73 n=1 Tax=Coptotermes formosanus TaxID=36987 RepID=A0A6L2PYT7_COPFO|nr:hypothetical protein Cfor_03839 [Coptotermes formosanus]